MAGDRLGRRITAGLVVLLFGASACTAGRIVPAPAGIVRRVAAGWKHNETLGATDVVHDDARGDLWIVAGVVHAGPDDGDIAVWAVSPRSALESATAGTVVAVNDVARSTNDLGKASGRSFLGLEHDAAVTTAITDLQASLASHVGGG
jgi:hypothetical protein